MPARCAFDTEQRDFLDLPSLARIGPPMRSAESPYRGCYSRRTHRHPSRNRSTSPHPAKLENRADRVGLSTRFGSLAGQGSLNLRQCPLGTQSLHPRMAHGRTPDRSRPGRTPCAPRSQSVLSPEARYETFTRSSIDHPGNIVRYFSTGRSVKSASLTKPSFTTN